MRIYSLIAVLALSAACSSAPLPTAPAALPPVAEVVAPAPAPAPAAPRFALVAFDGNSLTASRGGVPPYPSFIDLHGAPSINVAASGNATPDQDRLAVANLDPQRRPGGPNLIVFWEGANDLYYGSSPQKALENLRLYVAHRHAAGFKVIIGTLLPRNDAGLPSDYETKRQAVNAALRADWQTFADGFVDLAADPDMGPAGSWQNATYFLPDRVHLNEAGARRIAAHVGAAIDRFQP